jgi:hypothetical protein
LQHGVKSSNDPLDLPPTSAAFPSEPLSEISQYSCLTLFLTYLFRHPVIDGFLRSYSWSEAKPRKDPKKLMHDNETVSIEKAMNGQTIF